MVSTMLDLPGPMKAGLLLGAGGGAIGAVALAAPAYLPIAIVAIAVIALVMAGTLAFIRWRQKRKARPFEQSLMSDASATPSSASDARSMADLPELQRKFEEGVKTFRDRGKDIYSVPWYLVVGPSGGGKTEAIRHSGVPMPAGLQDKLQGVGGTYQMHWWFTEESVILDTAGRLVTDSAREWEKFLKLLRKNRPHCPINGMLLVIPADDLMRKSPGQVQEEGGKWADRLDDLQQSLGVRFPVFIVVTKTDLVRGFRAFFSEMNEPGQMMQMMGWSNPAGDIDQEFRPQDVAQHLHTVVDRLRRRRLAMLIDPRSRNDPVEGRRLDEVDTLYDFPDQFAKLGERLGLFLESAFAAGAWSSKPLFVRGIYFTSSMEEGREVDRLLADALGTSVDELGAGESFTRKRSLFLRDMFTQKVFREQGLVTNAGNVKKQQRRNRLVAMGGAISGIVLMIGATFYMANSFSSQIGRDNEFWRCVASMMELERTEWEIAAFEEGKAGYYGGNEIRRVEFPGDPLLAELAVQTREAAAKPRRTAWPFVLAAAVSGNPYERRDDAHREVFERTVLEPFVSATLRQLSRGEVEQSWRNEAEVTAFAHLVRFERQLRGSESFSGDGPPLDLEAMARAAFDYNDNEGWALLSEADRDARIEERRKQVRDLQEVLAWTYRSDGGAVWPPQSFNQTSGDRVDELVAAARRLRAWFAQATTGGESGVGALIELTQALKAYEEAEALLIDEVDFAGVSTTDEYAIQLGRWQERLSGLNAARGRVQAAASAAADPQIGWNAAQLIAKARAEAEGPARAAIAAMLAELPEKDVSRDLDRVRTEIEGLESDLDRTLGEQLASVQRELEDRAVLLQADRNGNPAYQNLYAIAERANALLTRPVGEVTLEELPARLDRARQGAMQAQDEVAQIAARAGAERARPMREKAERAIVAARRSEAAGLIKIAVGQLSDFGALVEQRVASDRTLRIDPIDIPLTDAWSERTDGRGLEIEPRFNPRGAQAITGAVDAVVATIEDTGNAPLDAQVLAGLIEDAKDEAREYREDLASYWGTQLAESLEVEPESTWKQTRSEFRSIAPSRTNDELVRAFTIADQAMRIAQPAPRSADYDIWQSWLRQKQAIEENKDFRDTLDDIRSSWRRLDDDAARAAEDILGLTPEQFQDEYLGTEVAIYADPDDEPMVAYWSQLIGACLESLSRDASSDAGRIATAIREDVVRFPVTRGGVQDLSIERVEQLIGAIASVPAPTGASSRGETLGEGAELEDYPDAQRMIQRMLPTAGLDNDLLKAIDERGRPWLRWLGGERANGRFDAPQWQLVLLPLTRERDAGKRLDRTGYTNLEIEVNGRKLVWEGDDAVAELEFIPQSGLGNEDPLALFASGGSIVLRFQNLATGEVEPVTIRSDWPALRLAANARGELSTERIDGNPIWLLPVEIERIGARYWIGIRFVQDGQEYRPFDPKDWPDSLAR